MRISILFCLAFFTFAGNAKADSLRCNNKVVLEGESTGEVILKCGEPMLQEKVGYVKIKDEYINVTKLYYDLGTGKFLHILEFQNGKLHAILRGPRQ